MHLGKNSSSSFSINFSFTNFRGQKVLQLSRLWPFSQDFVFLKILNKAIRESLSTLKQVRNTVRGFENAYFFVPLTLND